MAWSAATSIRPKSASSATSHIIMTATGWRAAPRWSSMRMARWKSRLGREARIEAMGRRGQARRPSRPRTGAGMKIALVSDAWAPQVNGVVRTLQTTVGIARGAGIRWRRSRPTLHAHSLPILSRDPPGDRLRPAVRRRLDALAPDAMHIATEGPLGWAARRWCLANAACLSRRRSTRASPIMWRCAPGLPPEWFWPILDASTPGRLDHGRDRYARRRTGRARPDPDAALVARRRSRRSSRPIMRR
jgi:hypothetical protein